MRSCSLAAVVAAAGRGLGLAQTELALCRAFRGLVSDGLSRLVVAVFPWLDPTHLTSVVPRDSIDESAKNSRGAAMSYTKDQMIAIGGKEWTKSDGTVRVYLNRIDNLIGLHVERYKSGNICYAELLGEKISNRRAAQIMSSEVYWEGGEIHTDIDPRYIDAVMHGIVCEVAEYAE